MDKLRVTLLALLVLLIFSACRQEQQPQKERPEAPETPVLTTEPTLREPDRVNPEGQLFCSAESQEDAQRIAELYDITLVEYSDGYALFFTEEDPKEVRDQGRIQGWPELSLNRRMELY